MSEIDDYEIRTGLRAGDLGAVVAWHGVLYARELGWDCTFEAYVAAPLAELACSDSGRQQIWIAEHAGELIGSVAITESDEPDVAQLRWFLVSPEARGKGLGSRLLSDAVNFARKAGYREVMLWTVAGLDAASRLYRAAGFRKVERLPGERWGASVVEEKFSLPL
jgi:N-acetylglutamate synthase-like GNAT family acetyltransferase